MRICKKAKDDIFAYAFPKKPCLCTEVSNLGVNMTLIITKIFVLRIWLIPRKSDHRVIGDRTVLMLYRRNAVVFAITRHHAC